MSEKICLGLAIVAGLMILLGLWMTFREWRKRQIPGNAPVKPEALDKDIDALTRLIKAIKELPPGQWLIVLGVVILIIALAFCGLGGITGHAGA